MEKVEQKRNIYNNTEEQELSIYKGVLSTIIHACELNTTTVEDIALTIQIVIDRIDQVLKNTA